MGPLALSRCHQVPLRGPGRWELEALPFEGSEVAGGPWEGTPARAGARQALDGPPHTCSRTGQSLRASACPSNQTWSSGRSGLKNGNPGLVGGRRVLRGSCGHEPRQPYCPLSPVWRAPGSCWGFPWGSPWDWGLESYTRRRQPRRGSAPWPGPRGRCLSGQVVFLGGFLPAVGHAALGLCVCVGRAEISVCCCGPEVVGRGSRELAAA